MNAILQPDFYQYKQDFFGCHLGFTILKLILQKSRSQMIPNLGWSDSGSPLAILQCNGSPSSTPNMCFGFYLSIFCAPI